MPHKHPELHSSTYCLRVKTYYAMGWVAHVFPLWYLLSGFWAGFCVSSVGGRTCAGSQMTLWPDEDLIREKPDSLPQV